MRVCLSSRTITSDADRIARGMSGVKDVHNELLAGRRAGGDWRETQ